MSGCCLAEETADYSAILDFAAEYGAKDEIQRFIERALTGELQLKEFSDAWVKENLEVALKEILPPSIAMIAPVLLLGLLGSMMPDSRGAGIDARFLLRMNLVLLASQLAVTSLNQIEICLETIQRFADVCAPALTAVLAATGMEGSAALISPAAALAGNLSQQLFLKYGMPLCRIALCLSIAGNLTTEIDLSRFTNLLRKGTNWFAALAATLFTALLALQGTISEGMDGVSVRTAKFAVESASPVIGSGISDVWENYISGVMISKNTLGVSSMAVLLFACARPVLLCVAAMIILALLSALLEFLGEKLSARAADQIGGICQMALSMCTAAIAIATILLGAVMSAGKGLFRI